MKENIEPIYRSLGEAISASLGHEAMGLQTLKAAGEIGVPGILGIGIDEGKGFSFLLLEYIDSAPHIKTYWETFGRQLPRPCIIGT
ncbi:MAG: fructosamine kinase family protein [Lachnospiraceae bacterium]|nr:fructosamine kinase family protein [Lachnospiraceae bacterium]